MGLLGHQRSFGSLLFMLDYINFSAPRGHPRHTSGPLGHYRLLGGPWQPTRPFSNIHIKVFPFLLEQIIFGHLMVVTRYISGPLNHQRSLYYNHVTILTPFPLGKIIFSAVKCADFVFWVEVFNNSD